MFLSADRQLLKKSCFIQRSILSMNMNLSIHLVYFDNSYYPRTYADIFCMVFCCNNPLLGRKGMRENEIF